MDEHVEFGGGGRAKTRRYRLSRKSLISSESAFIQEDGDLVIASPVLTSAPECCSRPASGDMDPYKKLETLGPVRLMVQGGEENVKAAGGEFLELSFEVTPPF